MANYITGNNFFTKNKARYQSILDINFNNGSLLCVFPGRLSPFDIVMKYKEPRTRLRTPKHIHWVVDLMVKQEHDARLTRQLLIAFQDQWNNTIPLTNRRMTTIRNSMQLSTNQTLLTTFASLNAYGFYNIDFLMHLMELLMVQEKTNNPNAYMFGDIINALIQNRDLFKIISTATHR
jgi:hypothetical protein